MGKIIFAEHRKQESRNCWETEEQFEIFESTEAEITTVKIKYKKQRGFKSITGEG